MTRDCYGIGREWLAPVTLRPSMRQTPAMNSIRIQLVTVTLCALVVACTRHTGAPRPVVSPIASKPDVIVTFDGERHACVVRLLDATTGHVVSCEDVLPFIRDSLKLRSGSVYDIRTIPDVDDAEMRRVVANLKGAGYRYIDGPHVMFLTGPHPDGE